MSDTTPPQDGPQDEPTTQIPTGEPTMILGMDGYVAAEPAAETRRSRKGIVLVSVAAVLTAAVGGGAYAAYSFLNGGGPQPADALPSSTIAMVSIDLDPNAGQKIEAIKTLRKFPALRETLGLDSQDDLRRYVFDKAVAEGQCDGLDYAADIKPWIGERAAVAAVDVGEDDPAPAIVLQVSDPKKAEAGLKEIADCVDADDFAYVIGEDYAIASDSDVHASTILKDGEAKPLADDATYQKWTDAAGDAGIATLYVAPAAGKYLADLVDEFASGFTQGFSESFDGGSGEASGSSDGDFSDFSEEDFNNFEEEFGDLSELEGTPGQSAPPATEEDPDPFASLRDSLEGFEGAAGTLRFADGGMEFVVAADAGDQKLGTDPVGKKVEALPSDTALALGLAIPSDLGDQMLDAARSQGGSFVDDFIDQAERETGLELPGDLQDLLGDAITLSVGGDAPTLEEFNDPEQVPVGLVIHGDADKTQAVISKVEDAVGLRLADIPIVTEKNDDRLVLSPSSAYAKELTKKGDLGDTDAFKRAVPDADSVGGLFFLALDKGWRETIVDLIGEDMSSESGQQIADNLAPLSAVGVSSSVKDGVGRFTLRIATR